MRPSENRKIKEPELEPVFVAGPDAFTDDYTDIFVMFFLSVRLPSKPSFSCMVLLCYDASESRRGAVLLRPFKGRDKIAPLPSVAAEPRSNPNHFTGGSGGRGENEVGATALTGLMQLSAAQRVTSGDTERCVGPDFAAPSRSLWRRLVSGPRFTRKAVRRSSFAKVTEDRQAATLHQPHRSGLVGEPQRHEDTKGKPPKMDRNPTFVPWCLGGESSGLLGAPSGRALPCLNLSRLT
jgi:hypothetical protein